MTKTANHTPTPWRRDETDESCFVIPRNDLQTVQIVCVLGEHSDVADATDYANAAFIVRAVNSHDALVEALEAVLYRQDKSKVLAALIRARGRDLHIDGTCPDDTLQSGEGEAPFYVFDADRQENIAGPFATKEEARAALTLAKGA